MTIYVGQCGNCGGVVTMPAIWHGITPPVPRCGSCGSTVRQRGPVLPMDPPRPRMAEDFPMWLIPYASNAADAAPGSRHVH